MKVLTLIISFIILLNCNKKVESSASESPESYAISLFSFGKVFKQNQEFKSKSILKENEELVLFPGSFADLQIVNKNWNFRIFGEARFALESYKKEDPLESWIFALLQGQILVKVRDKLKEKERFKIKTIAGSIGVRGTAFSVEIQKNGGVLLSVLEGSVSMNFAQNENAEIVIEKEKNLALNKEIIDKISKLSGSPDEISSAISKLTAPITKSMNDSEKKKLQAQMNEIIEVPGQELVLEQERNKFIDSKITEKTPELLIQMEKTSGKRKGIIVLTNGQEIPGLIEQKEKGFSVETPSESLSFPESQVLEISYE